MNEDDRVAAKYSIRSRYSDGLRVGRVGFESRQGDIFLKTGSEAHPVSYSIDAGGSFPGGKKARA
jgi:hypothetical protein